MTTNEARYYSRRDDGTVECGLCPHACVIKPGRSGICNVRRNEGGRLLAMTYGRAIALNHDPIEKKPLFHVLPGSRSTSVATAGCNLSCEHCQNHDISQYPVRHGEVPGRQLSPEQVVAAARQAGSATIALTYTEPTIFMEWGQDIAAAGAAVGVGCVSISNGFVQPEPLADLARHLLAANIDLKSFDDAFYRKVCGARLQPVLDAIAQLVRAGVWVEVTTLLIPGLNDDDAQLERMAGFLAGLDPAIPWHLSRFHPDNRMVDRGPTSPERIHRARQIGLGAGLRFVYSGNVWGDEGEHTRCPGCGRVLIERHGFSVLANQLAPGGRCPDCDETIEGVFE